MTASNERTNAQSSQPSRRIYRHAETATRDTRRVFGEPVPGKYRFGNDVGFASRLADFSATLEASSLFGSITPFHEMLATQNGTSANEPQDIWSPQHNISGKWNSAGK